MCQRVPIEDRHWDKVLEVLSSLITFKTRADSRAHDGWQDAFEQMPVYLERLGIDKQLDKLNVIHVAGTKGKGSTCAMVDSILRECGYRSGLFTSPHLCDVRERVRINGQLVSREVFSRHFWACYDALLTPGGDAQMPGYFRFLTLLGLHIFLAQPLDVVILEVGIGGRLDATNVVSRPVVCGITSLGFDHMELLGDTIELIAAEKAGILKPGSPAFSAPQPPGAMRVLLDRAAAVGTTLTVPPPLASFRASASDAAERGSREAAPAGPVLGVEGEHQALNASLAVQLAATWEADAGAALRPDAPARAAAVAAGQLPPEYARGLAATRWPGRSQVIEDEAFASPCGGSRLSFFLDGAHTPESMSTCAAWFTSAVGAHARAPGAPPAAAANGVAAANGASHGAEAAAAAGGALQPAATGDGRGGWASGAGGSEELQRVLVFNCTKERSPGVLLPELHASLVARGVHMHHALFVPPDSQYSYLAGSAAAERAARGSSDGTPQRDVSWQRQLRAVWDDECVGATSAAATLVQRSAPPPLPLPPLVGWTAGSLEAAADTTRGAVMPGVASTVKWLRSCVRARPRLRLQVLVTGSLYLVGDTLRTLGKAPS